MEKTIQQQEAENAALVAKIQADQAAAPSPQQDAGFKVLNGIAKVVFWPFRWLVPPDVRGD